MNMKNLAIRLLTVSFTYVLSVSTLYAASISGQIETDAPVKKMIVYLQPDSNNHYNDKDSKTHQVSQKETRFNPPLWVISVGDKIQWLNDEDKEIDHNIYSLHEKNHFDLGLGPRGSKLEQAFNHQGELNYYCSVHKNMEGKIVVLPSRYYQVLDQTRDFKIDNVPAGKWLLTAVLFHRRYKVEPVPLTIQQDMQNLTLKVVKR